MAQCRGRVLRDPSARWGADRPVPGRHSCMGRHPRPPQPGGSHHWPPQQRHGRARPAPGAPEPSTAEVRVWARAAGLAVPGRGKLRPEGWDAWRAAQPGW